jgi:hypothetical protein
LEHDQVTLSQACFRKGTGKHALGGVQMHHRGREVP